ncbi:MAG TPA: DUF4012 domain-containing protein, partial [Actinomycetota bacterium]|nr:DUF4012 domain-containing protein [Actinomycetota bacterium]
MLALAAFLLLALVGVLVDAYYQSDRIYGELEVVLPSLRQASDSLAKGQLPSGDPFRTADRAVRRAADAVDNSRFTFKLAGAIPLFGRPVHAIRHGVAAVGEVTRAAAISRRAVEDLLGDAAREPGSVRAADTPLYEGGVVNLKLLRGLTPRLDEVIAHLCAADREIRAIPSVPYLPNVARVRDRAILDAGRAIRLSQRALSGAKLLPGFLGEGGSKTYFVALQNNADLRGPGGGVTAYAILVAKDGRLRIVQGGDIRGFRVGSGSSRIRVSLPEELRWYVQNVPHAFTRINGVNYTPNFPLVAEAWARMASKVTGRRFDGVIEMDQFAIARLLGTSKIRVPAYPRPITGRNLVRVVSHDQYLLPVERQLEFPAQLIAAAWPKMLDPRSPQDFLASLGQLLREKRIQLWSAAPDLQEWLRRLGWDGGVRVGEGDYLYVVDNKVVPNKVDYYGRLAVNYDVTIDTSGDAHAKLEVTLTNGSPPG